MSFLIKFYNAKFVDTFIFRYLFIFHSSELHFSEDVIKSFVISMKAYNFMRLQINERLHITNV